MLQRRLLAAAILSLASTPVLGADSHALETCRRIRPFVGAAPASTQLQWCTLIAHCPAIGQSLMGLLAHCQTSGINATSQESLGVRTSEGSLQQAHLLSDRVCNEKCSAAILSIYDAAAHTTDTAIESSSWHWANRFAALYESESYQNSSAIHDMLSHSMSTTIEKVQKCLRVSSIDESSLGLETPLELILGGGDAISDVENLMRAQCKSSFVDWAIRKAQFLLGYTRAVQTLSLQQEHGNYTPLQLVVSFGVFLLILVILSCLVCNTIRRFLNEPECYKCMNAFAPVSHACLKTWGCVRKKPNYEEQQPLDYADDDSGAEGRCQRDVHNETMPAP